MSRQRKQDATLTVPHGPGIVAIVARTAASWAVTLIAAITSHQNDGGIAFLSNPGPFLAPESKLTTAQKCNIFNFAMSLCGIGLTMPKDDSGEKVWDVAIFDRGMALAKGRPVNLNHWASQKYQPLIVPGRTKLRSFYTGMTEAARLGVLVDVDPKQFAGLDKEATQEALRQWFIATVNRLTGTKTAPGVLASSFRSVAIRADLPERAAKGSKAKTVTAESLLAEYGQA